MNEFRLIKHDIKNNLFTWTILCVGMMPFWLRGYCMYFLILLFPLIFRVKIEKPAGIILALSIIYVVFMLIGGAEYTPSELVFDLTYPIIMYQAAASLVYTQKQPKSMVFLFTLMILCLGLPAIINNILDVVQTGELINVTRAIVFDGDISRSATGYAMMIAILNGCLGLVLFKPKSKFDSTLKYVMVIASGAAIFSTIHLVTRTGLVISVISVCIAAILPPNKFRQFFYTIISLFIVFLTFYIIFSDSSFFQDAMSFYDAREAIENSNSTYGGRTQRWMAGISQIFHEPFGNAKGVFLNNRHTYAHNLWLDIGAKGGIVCLVLIILFTYTSIKATRTMYKNNYLSIFEKNYLILIFSSIILQSFVEPVKEGVPQLYWIFIFYTSTIYNLNRKYKNISKTTPKLTPNRYNFKL